MESDPIPHQTMLPGNVGESQRNIDCGAAGTSELSGIPADTEDVNVGGDADMFFDDESALDFQYRASCSGRLLHFIISYRDQKIPILLPHICTVGMSLLHMPTVSSKVCKCHGPISPS